MNKYLLMVMIFFNFAWGLAVAEVPLFDKSDELAATYISQGHYRKAIDILLSLIKKNSAFDDDEINKRLSLYDYKDAVRRYRYLSTVDYISLIFRLAECFNLPESELKPMLAPYMNALNKPESFQEFVIALEYRLALWRLEDIEQLLNQFKRYLYTYFGDWQADKEEVKEQEMGYLYYYPYLMGRYLFLIGKYDESVQYLRLALMFRPSYNGIASCDIINGYQKVGQEREANKLIQSMLASPRKTAEFAFFNSLYHE